METKICSKCKKEKDVCEFGKDSSRTNGLSYLCKECLLEKTKKYRDRNREKVLQSYKEYSSKNKEIIKEKRKIRDGKNYVKISEYRKKYFNENKLYFYELEKNRRKNDVLFKITGNVRKRINTFLKINNISKKNKTFDIVGCSPEFLKEFLENKFTEGMSWDKMGKDIHIDHIIPLSSAKTEEEVYGLCHYTNLQPLWAYDNLSKGDKIL
jgi:hypothetical protein